MAQCNILYNGEKMRLKIPLESALRKKNLQPFIDFITKYKAGQQIRLVPNEGDTDTDVIIAMRKLDADIQEILRNWDSRHPSSFVYDKVLAEIHQALNVEDNTQTVTEADDTETKTKDEVLDKNASNLTEHLVEFYGLESFDIISSLKQTFEDMIASAAYYDMDSGTVINQNNATLNKNIQNLKNKLFKTIVDYMKLEYADDPAITALVDTAYTENGFDSINYYKVLSTFYRKVHDLSDFKDQLTKVNADKIKGTVKTEKTNLYKALVKELEKDENFVKRMNRRFPGEKGILLKSQLYTADHFSEYFAEVKKFIEKHKPELMERITGIEQVDRNILEAANAYTMLRHFDSLLTEVYGDQISMAQGTRDYEADIPNKYQYHVDTAHEIKGWQTSEDIGSEKHTSRFTNAVIDMIRLYDYKTGEYLHRRADNTTLIVAARNFINAILTGKVTFLKGSASRNAAIDELKNCVIRFHDDPVVNLQRMLELLFERQPNVPQALVNSASNRKDLYDYDFSVLKSVYNVVFNKNNPQSFYSQSLKSMKGNNPAIQSLLEEIAGFVDRNVTAAYLETEYDFETGRVDIHAKKKYFNNKQLYKVQTGINNFVNIMSLDKRSTIASKYDFQYAEGSSDTNYTVKIGNDVIALQIPNTTKAQILGNNPNNGRQMKFVVSEGLFEALNAIDLIHFRYKIENKIALDDSEQKLRNVLQFLDDTLDLGILSAGSVGLQTLYTYKELYNPIDNMKNYLMPLIKLGIRAAYANDMYLKSKGTALSTYLSERNDPLYSFYMQNRRTSKIMTERFSHLQYRIASYADDVLNNWVDAQSILRGEASKATTKDKQGNSIPNNSVAKLGGILHYYLDKQLNTNADSLLFVKNPDLIKSTFHDLEVTNMLGESKSVRAFSNSELFFHAIFNKFWGNYLSNGNIIVQPTTYSDKTTFLNWEVNATIIDDNKQKVNLVQADTSTIISLYQQTLGQLYRRVFESTREKLTKIANIFASRNSLAATDYRDIMHQMTEQDLVKIAGELGYDVELNKDYRLVKNAEGKTVCGVNASLEYNADTYNDMEALTQKLKGQESLFLSQLLQNNCVYQVLDGNDTVDMYLENKISDKATTKNPVLHTILEYFKDNVDKRRDFFNNWVDALTGKLILGKQNGRNIISISDVFNAEESVQLNPLFEKFFYIEGLYSNNLRFSLTGSELNHPAGKKSIFNTIRKTETLEDWNAKNLGTLTKEDWKLLHNTAKTGVLDDIIDLDQLKRRLMSGALPVDSNAFKVLHRLTEKAYSYETNTAQGTQFKRNVIIPATLQYVTQNVKDGVPKKIRCAVIRDQAAPVFNYRGDHEDDIDACDGSAQITAFQAIMENRALGSQAVGFIKKPIWHSYDANSGTAFLAKFATDTMTNEAMRTSLMSTTNLYKMFEKATNLQWNPEDNIDLTKSLVLNQSFGGTETLDFTHENWFNNVILGGQKLFYKNKYGEITQIKGFNKTVTQDGKTLYYTEEFNPNAISEANATLTRKYHIFYNNGKTKSAHITANTWQQAVKLLDTLDGAHTINSLFELHKALGGIYCVDHKGMGSEFNNEVVVNFMCNVGSIKPGVPSDAYINQETYDQPLKKYHIGYLFNASSVKNGAKNMNPAERWTDDADLSTFEVDSDGLGMQMNADHDIVNSELTEFSQVIAATAAYGYTYDNCNEIFQGLARTAFQASETTLNATDNFIKSLGTDNEAAAWSDLYDAIGRIILVNSKIRDTENLTNIIMQGVNTVFNKYKNHTDDPTKIPFSDPNIYSDFISTLASTITKQSIKRKHPGSGCVMAPAYNMIQYFEIGTPALGFQKLMTADIIKRAEKDYKTDLLTFLQSSPKYDAKQEAIKIGNEIEYISEVTPLSTLERLALALDNTGAFSRYFIASADVALSNQHYIKTYLEKQQELVRKETGPLDRAWFMPTDIVDVIGPDGTLIESVNLDSLDVYYKFKDGKNALGIAYPEGCTYQICVTKPHNLRPSLIRWKYKGADNQEHYMNIFDHPVLRQAYEAGGAKTAEYRQKIQDVLHHLHEGYFIDAEGNKRDVIEGTLENEEAELVMSNLYKETFGVENESLSEILAQGESYFINKIANYHTPVSHIYDMAFLKDNGKHTLITIGNVTMDDTVTVSPFANTMTNEKDEIVLMKDGRELLEVGKWADIDANADNAVVYNDQLQRFVSNSDEEIDQSMYRIKDGKVQKRYDYVTRYNVVSKRKSKNGDIVYQTNTLYKIADVSVFRDALHATRDSDAIKQQSSIISKIYNSGDYKMAQINPIKKWQESKKRALENSLQFLLTNFHVSKDVKAVLKAQLDTLGQDNEKNRKAFAEARKSFLMKEAHHKWTSFQDSLKFIAARIPAQTLQSFMAMKCVAWTENSKNMAYVSHFQTYLQGSDYDMQKKCCSKTVLIAENSELPSDN